MKILSIKNYYNNSQNSTHIASQNTFSFNNALKADVVSFRAKKYDDETILNPTNHCAYCGSKVYTEHQLNGIAKEILSSKYDRMRGIIKSVLEKLEAAKQSEELSIAKRFENEEEIKFFKNFLEVASKKSFLKGEAIFEQVYGKNSDEALETLNNNLHPLLKTIDHVSPQNEAKDNNHSDINLVEACWCCNHDLKKGVSFAEFYTMYPSIKNNMPPEKFQYASSSLLDSQSNGILQRLTAANLLKTLQRLFVQRAEAKTYLDSIDFRITNSTASIREAIESSRTELAEKEQELRDKENQFEQLKQDDEFQSILDRIGLSKSIETHESILAQLRTKSQHLSNQINELRNPPKKKSSKPSKDSKTQELTPEEKQAKIESLKEQIQHIESQIQEQKDEISRLSDDIALLDEEFPTIIMMQHEKNQADSIVSAHIQLAKIQQEIDEKEAEMQDKQAESDELARLLSEYPDTYPKVETFPKDVQDGYSRFIDLLQAFEYIEGHPNGNNITSLIKQMAKDNIETEIQALSSNSLVIQYTMQQKQTELRSQKSILDKAITGLHNNLSNLRNSQAKLRKDASLMTKEEASQLSQQLADRIRNTSEKEQYTKLPQVIEYIKSEITLINQTISDLEIKLSQIESQFSST